ncbi:glutathione S-transferase N-terminal domain-containing protein [Marinomonas sp. C2222]|uniref:Glutathione S-transferase N-terminal domain-containing protein n=1 Tax=Marinomonas sargassi TaxID=2984494 RepID=A0ABT2YTX2_9GAMM|nr:glutathione S-transferase N-terminal domain-containing protein [Marinomonas sargassi]MCV2403344.1 glutathione S-transferase N-terminal domain-containing protein [Marinomonas sargassi]
MKFFIQFIRNLLGYTIIIVDFLTRGQKLKRSPEQQLEVNEQLKSLSLYQFSACPFCTKTRRAMHKLNLPIEKRNASIGSSYRMELLEGGGKLKVPCLRIEENNKVSWLYESSDIITYLEKRFER